MSSNSEGYDSDNSSADFTQRTKERIRCDSEARRRKVKDKRFQQELIDMHSSGGSGEIKAQAYLLSSIDAKSKRTNRAKVLKGKKAKKVKKEKTIKESAAKLFRVTVDELEPPVNGRCANGTGSPKQPSSTTNGIVHSDVFSPNIRYSSESYTPTPVSVRDHHTPATHSTVTTTISYSSSANAANASPKESPNGNGVFDKVVCHGCGCPSSSCHELKYRRFCLQQVMDHFEDDGIRFTDELGVYTCFIRAYTCCVKKDMLDKHNFYDRRREIEIPDCMVKGSLAQVQDLRTTDHLR